MLRLILHNNKPKTVIDVFYVSCCHFMLIWLPSNGSNTNLKNHVDSFFLRGDITATEKTKKKNQMQVVFWTVDLERKIMSMVSRTRDLRDDLRDTVVFKITNDEMQRQWEPGQTLGKVMSPGSLFALFIYPIFFLHPPHLPGPQNWPGRCCCKPH